MSENNLDNPTTREVIIMLKHIQGELDDLSTVLYSAMPKGSPERHLIEHELAEQERLDKAKRRSDFWGHMFRTAAAAIMILIAGWSYQGIVSMVSNSQKQAVEVVK